MGGCLATEDAFVAGGGVDLLLQLLQVSKRVKHTFSVSQRVHTLIIYFN